MPQKIRTVEKFLAQMPKESYALHGTLAKNVPGILSRGIVNGLPYTCPVVDPTILYLPKEQEKHRKILEKIIGSTLFAGKYALAKTFYQDTEDENLPVMIIAKGTDGEFMGAYDDDKWLNRAKQTTRKKPPGFSGRVNYGEVEYQSFGKIPGDIPPKNILSVVQVTRKDLDALRDKSKNQFHFQRLIEAHLSVKVLKELKRLAAEHAAAQKE